MKIIDFNEISSLNIGYDEFVKWIDFPLKNREMFVFPVKSRIPLSGNDYMNLMPCALKEKNIIGLKIINRNELRRDSDQINLDSQILLYKYDTGNLLAVMDGNYITTVRTAATAVHTINNMVDEYNIISLIGLGNIMNVVGEMMLRNINKKVTVKLMDYKDHAHKFKERFSGNENINFQISYSYSDLMRDSDLIISAVSYVEEDFCKSEVYKKGCTIIPIHLRGFMDCDKNFDNIVTSDLVRIEGFKNYNSMKRVIYTDNILKGSSLIRNNIDDRTIIYNFGLAISDVYFAIKMLELFDESNHVQIKLGPDKKYYI